MEKRFSDKFSSLTGNTRNLADQIQQLQLAGLIICGTDNCQKESENYTDQDSTKGYN